MTKEYLQNQKVIHLLRILSGSQTDSIHKNIEWTIALFAHNGQHVPMEEW